MQEVRSPNLLSSARGFTFQPGQCSRLGPGAAAASRTRPHASRVSAETSGAIAYGVFGVWAGRPLPVGRTETRPHLLRSSMRAVGPPKAAIGGPTAQRTVDSRLAAELGTMPTGALACPNRHHSSHAGADHWVLFRLIWIGCRRRHRIRAAPRCPGCRRGVSPGRRQGHRDRVRRHRARHPRTRQ